MLTQPIQLTQKEPQGYEVLPQDIYQVELFDVSSEEKPTFDTKNKPLAEQKFETVLNFHFVCLEGEHRGRYIYANFVPTYFYVSKKSGKNKLYRIVEALIGKDLRMEEYTQFEMDASEFLNSLVGKQCRIVIEHKQSGENTYANPSNYMKANSLQTALTHGERTDIIAKLNEAKAKKNETSVSVPEGHPDEIRVEDIEF